MLDGAEKVGDVRGYVVFTGHHDGRRLTVATSGVGSPSMSIAVEELAACGARTFIRVGSCAAISDRLPVGGIDDRHWRGVRRGYESLLRPDRTSRLFARSESSTPCVTAAASTGRTASSSG